MIGKRLRKYERVWMEKFRYKVNEDPHEANKDVNNNCPIDSFPGYIFLPEYMAQYQDYYIGDKDDAKDGVSQDKQGVSCEAVSPCGAQFW